MFLKWNDLQRWGWEVGGSLRYLLREKKGISGGWGQELAESVGQGHRVLLPCGLWRNLGVK